MVARSIWTLAALLWAAPALAQEDEEAESTDEAEAEAEDEVEVEVEVEVEDEVEDEDEDEDDPEADADPETDPKGEPEGEPEGDPEPEAAGTAPDREGYSPVVGLQLGPTFSLSPLKATVLPRIEGGVELPWWERRLRAWVSVAHARPATEGELTDPRVTDDDWSYRLTQSEWLLGLGATVRVHDLGWPVVPEASIGPALYLLRTRTHGEAAASDFNENREVYTRGGLYSALGASLDLWFGEATLHVVFTSSGLNGTLTGPSKSAALAPILGYRLVL